MMPQELKTMFADNLRLHPSVQPLPPHDKLNIKCSSIILRCAGTEVLNLTTRRLIYNILSGAAQQ